MKDSINEEITLELLFDLQRAIKEVTDKVLPQLGAEVKIVKKPYLGIYIKVEKGVTSEHYPEFIESSVLFRPTRPAKKLLGLSED